MTSKRRILLRSDVCRRILSWRVIVNAPATASLWHTACLALYVDAVWRSISSDRDGTLITCAPQCAFKIVEILCPLVQSLTVGLARAQLRAKRHDHIVRLYHAVERIVRCAKPVMTELEHV